MSARVGLFLSRQALTQDPSSWREALSAMADAGLDHVGSADHISFHTGWGIDGIVHAATLAALEPRLDVAIGVYLLALRHPVPVARQIVTLTQALGPTRTLELGIGVAGEDRHEIEICGVDPATRGRRTDESLSVLRALLTGAPLDHEGEFFSMRAAQILPRPPAKVRIVVGGRTPAALRRTGLYGDGWLGIWTTPQQYGGRIASISEVAGARVPDGGWQHGLQVWVGVGDTPAEGAVAVGKEMEAMYQVPFERFAKFAPCGTPDDIARAFHAYVEAGCTGFNVAVYSASGRWSDAVEAMAEVKRLLG